MDIDSIKQQILTQLQSQTDPTSQPYVKDASFYNSIVSTPVENVKRANFEATQQMLPLVQALYNNGMLEKSRQNVMPIVQSLMQGNSASAEQDALIRNEQAKRAMVASVMQNSRDIKNPLEYANVMQLAGIDPKYGLQYGFSTKEQTNDNRMKGLTSLAQIQHGEDALAQQASHFQQQLAKQRELTSMKQQGQSGIDPNKAMSAMKRYREITKDIENYSRQTGVTPEMLKNYVNNYSNEVALLASQVPINNAQGENDMWFNWEKGVVPSMIPAYLQNVGTPERQVQATQAPVAQTQAQPQVHDLTPSILNWLKTVQDTAGGNFDPYYMQR